MCFQLFFLISATLFLPIMLKNTFACQSCRESVCHLVECVHYELFAHIPDPSQNTKATLQYTQHCLLIYTLTGCNNQNNADSSPHTTHYLRPVYFGEWLPQQRLSFLSVITGNIDPIGHQSTVLHLISYLGIKLAADLLVQCWSSDVVTWN